MSSDKDTDLKRVRDAANALGEHFETVQIFCSRHESGSDDGTVTIQLGVGNWFARYGQIQLWLVKSDEDSRSDARRTNPEPL